MVAVGSIGWAGHEVCERELEPRFGLIHWNTGLGHYEMGGGNHREGV